MDVAPRAHARDGDAEGGNGRLAERSDKPSAHASAALGLSAAVASLRAMLKALPQSERWYWTTVTFSS